jgi:NAD(P)-dependent dehydrogenase (short-subunit alcohol dehydrogenase family)
MPDRAAIVTGGSRGIGRAIADALAAEGCGLTITARKPENLEAAVAELEAAGADVQSVAINLADENAPAEIVARHKERFGRLDVLVNNAGVGIGATATDHQVKHMDLQFNVKPAQQGEQSQGVQRALTRFHLVDVSTVHSDVLSKLLLGQVGSLTHLTHKGTELARTVHASPDAFTQVI